MASNTQFVDFSMKDSDGLKVQHNYRVSLRNCDAYVQKIYCLDSDNLFKKGFRPGMIVDFREASPLSSARNMRTQSMPFQASSPSHRGSFSGGMTPRQNSLPAQSTHPAARTPHRHSVSGLTPQQSPNAAVMDDDPFAQVEAALAQQKPRYGRSQSLSMTYTPTSTSVPARSPQSQSVAQPSQTMRRNSGISPHARRNSAISQQKPLISNTEQLNKDIVSTTLKLDDVQIAHDDYERKMTAEEKTLTKELEDLNAQLSSLQSSFDLKKAELATRIFEKKTEVRQTRERVQVRVDAMNEALQPDRVVLDGLQNELNIITGQATDIEAERKKMHTATNHIRHKLEQSHEAVKQGQEDAAKAKEDLMALICDVIVIQNLSVGVLQFLQESQYNASQSRARAKSVGKSTE